MNEDLIFVELLKIMSTKDKEVLSNSIRTNRIDLIRSTIVEFLKKYRGNLLHLL